MRKMRRKSSEIELKKISSSWLAYVGINIAFMSIRLILQCLLMLVLLVSKFFRSTQFPEMRHDMTYLVSQGILLTSN